MNHESVESLVARVERAMVECRRHSLGWFVVGTFAGAGAMVAIAHAMGRCT